MQLAIGKMLAAIGARKLVARSARYLSNAARLDCENSIAANGESDIQCKIAELIEGASQRVILDIGANRGEWTQSFLDKCALQGRRDFTVHAFEPVSGTIDIMKDNLQQAIQAGRVVPVNAGMSDECRQSVIYLVGAVAGTNALQADPTMKDLPSQVVDLWTIDSYCEENSIDHLLYAKVDVEGHDLQVLKGAANMLRRGAIDCLQFEYNHRWIWSRAFLRDAFEIANMSGYVIGKVTPVGVEVYKQWHPELEKFVEGNYVIYKQTNPLRFREIAWWNH